MTASLILFITACGLLAIGVPVAFALGLSTLAAITLGTSFPLLCC